jgi:hypothetical protein
MSKHNKVNPGQYHIAGRLTPDELARERVKQRNVSSQQDSAPQAEAGPPAQPEGAREKGAAGAPSLMPGKTTPAKTRARTKTAGGSGG